VSLAKRLYGLVGVLLAFLVLMAVVSISSSDHMFTIVLLVLGVLLGGGIAFVVVRELTRGVEANIERMAAVEKAAKENLMAGLQALAAGDLTVKLTAKTAAASGFSKNELGRMMRQTESMRTVVVECYGAYNLTVDTLSSLIGEVSSAAGSVGAASQEMSSTSEEAGKATGEIAQAIGEVAAGAERQARMASDAQHSAAEIVSAVAETAENAERTAEVANNAHLVAQQGVDAAEKANDAMRSVTASSDAVTETIHALAVSSGQIGTIVQTITAIARQTNLLALNAAIEAARAGEQGRGFAVVAEEVRKLAEESARAADQISELIATMQSETTKAVAVVEDGAKRTRDGAAVVGQAREAFVSISQAVEDMNTRIEQIAAAAEQITASASSMQQNVGEVATVAEQSSAASQEVSASTEQTSASAQEIAASAHELANHAEQLNRLVGRFQINHSGGGSVSDVLGSALEAHQAWRTRLLEAIETGKSSMSVQEAGHDDRCNFGKWLHGSGTLRDRDPRRWQRLHDLHEQFHRNAAEVLGLATSGRTTEAKERMQASEFVNIERQLQEALQTAAVR
jgi:methyl-accepting chemotaxis protein